MTAARELVAEIATERERRLFGRCVYCGSHCRGLACGSHRDLLHLDPNQYAMRLRAVDRQPEGAVSP